MKWQHSIVNESNQHLEEKIQKPEEPDLVCQDPVGVVERRGREQIHLEE